LRQASLEQGARHEGEITQGVDSVMLGRIFLYWEHHAFREFSRVRHEIRGTAGNEILPVVTIDWEATMEDQSGAPNLAAEQVRWEIDKLDAKRRLLEEVIGLVQHDRALNSSVTRIVATMATLAERDPAPFWRDRSTSTAARAELAVPAFAAGIPTPGDLFAEIVNLIKAEKAMIQELIKDLLT
jgi:hypothetical protein